MMEVFRRSGQQLSSAHYELKKYLKILLMVDF